MPTIFQKIRTWNLSLFCALTLAACGGAARDDADNADADASTNLADLGQAYAMDFQFGIVIDSLSDDYDVDMPLSTAVYSITLYVKDDGTVSLRTVDFPNIIYRICELESERTDCDAYTDATTEDVDLVTDSCNYSDDSFCDDTDQTVIAGTLSDSGRFRMDNVPIRSRIFAVSSNSDGTNADDTDTGLVDVEPLTTDLTTGTVTITGGEGMTAAGQPLDTAGDIVIVGGGIIPASYPVLANSYFMGTIDGNFADNPLEIFQN